MTCPSSARDSSCATAGAYVVSTVLTWSPPRKGEDGQDDDAEPQQRLLGGVDAGVRAHGVFLSEAGFSVVSRLRFSRPYRAWVSPWCSPPGCQREGVAVASALSHVDPRTRAAVAR